MPQYSAFTRYGHLRYSRKEALGQRIYRNLRSSLRAFNQAFDSSPIQARLYAWSMGFANALNTLERARNQRNPRKALELLPNLEREFRIIPSPTATISERQAELVIRMLVSRGSAREAVTAILLEILGDDLVEYRTTEAEDIITHPPNPQTVGHWVKPGTIGCVLKLLESAAPTRGTVQFDLVHGELPKSGQTAIVNAHDSTLREVVTLTSVFFSDTPPIGDFLTATFLRTHYKGSLITTQRFAVGESTARHNLIIGAQSAAENPETRRRVHEAMHRVLRAVSTWDFAYNGPFTVQFGKIGMTTIGTI